MNTTTKKISRPALAIYMLITGLTAAIAIYASSQTSVLIATLRVVQFSFVFISMGMLLALMTWGDSGTSIKEKWFSKHHHGDAVIAAVTGWYFTAVAALFGAAIASIL